MPGSDPPAEAFTEDALLGGRVRLTQPREGFRAALDPVLLAAFIPARPGETVLEAGCGSGAAFLCLNARVTGLMVHAIERDAEMAALARRNAEANGVSSEVHVADIRTPTPLPRCDHAFANPPYWPGGTPSPQPRRRDAAHEDAALEDWVATLARPLRHLGTLTLVLPASRFAAAAAALRGAGCGSVRLLPLWPRAGVAAKRVLIQARRGGRGADEVLPGLVLHEADGTFTQAAEAVLRGGAALP